MQQSAKSSYRQCLFSPIGVFSKHRKDTRKPIVNIIKRVKHELVKFTQTGIGRDLIMANFIYIITNRQYALKPKGNRKAAAASGR